MKFWDSSAIVPLLVQEAASQSTENLLRHDPDLLVAWSASLECVSALCRKEREKALDAAGLSTALQRLKILEDHWHEVVVSDQLKAVCRRLLRTHALRAADAVQLGSAIVACGNRPGKYELVTLDQPLKTIAEKEGFQVAP